MSLGALGYVGYGVETVEGTPVAPTIFLPVSSFSFEDTNDYITPDQIRGTRDRYVLMAAPYMTSGSMDMELTPSGIGPLLTSAFASGGATSSAYTGGGFQHLITPGNSSPTFTFESSAADILVMRYGGVRVNTLEISAAFGEIVTASWGLEGTTRLKHTGPSAESYASLDPFSFTGASVKVAGVEVGNVKSFTASVGNNLDRNGTLRKTRSWKRTAFGMRDLGLSLTMDFTDTADYDLFLAETEFSVELHMEGSIQTPFTTARPTLRLTYPRVRWGSVGVPLSTADYLEQTVEAIVMRPVASGNAVDVVLVNDVATI
jgi:hypothetical protein